MTCILYRIWEPETHGRCLDVHDDKGVSVSCEDVIFTGKCPKNLISPYSKVKR
jgi:hypothetical protein